MPPQDIIKPTITNITQSLMTGRVGQTRMKAIVTLAKKKNISRNDARFYQATRIAQSKTRKQNG